MGEFLLIVPPGWIEIPGDIDVLTASFGGEMEVINLINQNPNNVDSILEPIGLPPQNMTVMEAKIYRDAGTLRLWVQYGPTGN